MEKAAMTTAQDTAGMIWAYVPSLVGALAILVIGWIVAGLIARGARLGVEKTNLVGRVTKVVGDFEPADIRAMERWVGRVVFLTLMLFVLIGFFQVLGLNQITLPITGFLNQVFEYLPRLFGPVVLVLIAWVVAKFLRIATKRGLSSTKLDERLEKDADLAGERRISVSETAGEAVYWLTFLVFLPAVLSSLELGGLLGPVRTVVDELLGYLPNLFAAGLILAIGWVAARIIRKIVTNLLRAVGTDSLGERIGLHGALAGRDLSELVGLVIYVLILVPVIVSALNALELSAITLPASRMLDEILLALPNLFAGVLLLVIAYIVARIVGSLSTSLLAGLGFDTLPVKLGVSADVVEKSRKPSDIAGFLLVVAILLIASVEALSLIGFETAADLVAGFLVFSGHILLGLFIIALGLFIAKVVAEALRESGVPNGNLLAMLARAAILILAFAMGFGEMGVGQEIIALAFGLALGAVAVALAIAFGIGGRDAAAKVVAKWAAGAEPVSADAAESGPKRSRRRSGTSKTED